jgi:FkbM family methyltransferase
MELASGTVRHVRGGQLLRTLHSVLPLGRKYHPLLSLLNSSQGLLLVPFSRHEIFLPAAWHKLIAIVLLTQKNVVPEFELLVPALRQLKKGCLVDVGANLGLYTLLMRENSPLPIIAYEPQPFLCDLIRRDIEHNHLADIELRNVGCGAERGEVPFYVGTNGSVALGRNAPVESRPTSLPTDWEQRAQRLYHCDVVMKVPLTTLDEDLTQVSGIALLKIDCEGFEYNILQGARKIIERYKPQLFIEIHPAELEKFGHSAQMVVEFLRPFYELEFWCFYPPRRNRLAQSIAKFRTPRGFRYANETEMLNAVKSEPRPSQIYCIGRPR